MFIFGRGYSTIAIERPVALNGPLVYFLLKSKPANLMQNRSCPLCHSPHSRLKYFVDAFRIVKCLDCGFVYLDNPFQIKDEQQNYEDYFHSAKLAEYNEISKDENIKQARNINEQRLRLIGKYSPGEKMLDVGCGRGFFLHHAQEKGFHGEGVEISRLAAQYASEHYNLTVHICNLEQELNVDGNFDVITLWHVLEHFQNPRLVLENIRQLLNPGGRIFIEVPNLNSLKFQLSSRKNKWRGGNHPKYHRSFFTRETLDRMLETAGFSTIQNVHMIYNARSSSALYLIKKILNAVRRDSFLDVTAVLPSSE